MAVVDMAEYVLLRARELGFTKAKLAERAGMSRQFLHNLLNDGSVWPGTRAVLDLAAALDTHPLILFRLLCLKTGGQRRPTKDLPTDGSLFVDDVNYPDNDRVSPGEVFKKIWRIQNIGQTPWIQRRLVCQDDDLVTYRRVGDELKLCTLLEPLEREVPIPDTEPGALADIAVTFRAPVAPGTVLSYWKQTDSNGVILYPNAMGLVCRVRIISLWAASTDSDMKLIRKLNPPPQLCVS